MPERLLCLLLSTLMLMLCMAVPAGAAELEDVVDEPLATAEPVIPAQNLEKGDKNDDVLRMQNRLSELGYLSGTCDGDFGTNTQNALMQFQLAAGLEITGVGDTRTLTALYSDAAPTADALSAMTNPAPIGLPEGPRVDDSYFTDTVFVGDSVTLKLDYYVREQRQGSSPNLLANAIFLCAGSMGSVNVQQPISADSLHPTYRGDKVYVDDAVAALGAKRVYIMLGMNDIGEFGLADSVTSMLKLITSIHQKSPDTLIYIQSVTPRLRGKDQRVLNNANLRLYNAALYTAVAPLESQGVYFVDVASALRDEEGYLPEAYCSDPEDQGIHFTDLACGIWIEYLYTHTR